MTSIAPRNPNCKADGGKPCGFCATDWWEPHHLSKRAVPTDRCLQEQEERVPRRIDEGGSYSYCCCNHCFLVRKDLRMKEERASTMLADALEALFESLAPSVCAQEEHTERPCLWCRAKHALRAAGRLGGEK